MKRLSIPCAAALTLPVQSLAETFDRPVPQAQSATAEFWYAFACVALVLALIVMARLVARR